MCLRGGVSQHPCGSVSVTTPLKVATSDPVACPPEANAHEMHVRHRRDGAVPNTLPSASATYHANSPSKHGVPRQAKGAHAVPRARGVLDRYGSARPDRKRVLRDAMTTIDTQALGDGDTDHDIHLKPRACANPAQRPPRFVRIFSALCRTTAPCLRPMPRRFILGMPAFSCRGSSSTRTTTHSPSPTSTSRPLSELKPISCTVRM